MSTVDELKAAWLQKVALVAAARDAAHEAEQAYKKAAFEATRLAGCVVERTTWRGTVVRFVALSSGWSADRVSGPIVKKNGALGERIVEAPISQVVNLGPYQAPGSVAP